MQTHAALRSLFELKDIGPSSSLDLYFGPKPPASKEGEWIKTIPSKGWFVYFRIYGPEQAALDGSWKPGDLEEIEESVQDHSSHPPGIHGIREWEQEMSDYENVDPENRLRYHNTESELRVEEKMRMEDFLHHHQIWDKFITADADGER